MKGITPLNIINWCGGTYKGPDDILNTEVASITTDSRKHEDGCLFIPIKGAHFDGHDFIPQMIDEGALVCLTERQEYADGYPCIYVESTLEAIKIIAREYLKGLDVKVIAITGSVGKTSTKEMIYSVVSTKYRTLKTMGNFNNSLGLPLTIFNLREDDEVAVLEMGINHFGEMTELSSIAPPDISVITNIGECHLEFLGDRDGVLKAKTEMFRNLKPGGKIVLNGDDDKLITVRDVNGTKPVFYGIDTRRDIFADNIKVNGIYGTDFTVRGMGHEFDVRIAIPGRHMVLNALAAVSCGMLLGIDPSDIKAGLEKAEGISGRLNIINNRDIIIIDDCYNANPVSMKAALQILENSRGRRVAVLGDMGELGENSDSFHREIGEYAAAKCDILVTVGERSENMAEAALKTMPEDRVYHFDDTESFIKESANVIKKGDTVLVKASHVMGFERVIESLRSV